MSFDNFFDAAGLLGNRLAHEEFDGGDSAQKMGLYRFGRYLKNKNNAELIARDEAKFEQELDMLEVPDRPGWYVRHPSNLTWMRNPNNFSRDQHRSIVIAMGALKRRKRLVRTLWEHIKRYGFYQNTHKHDGTKKLVGDLCAPDHWGEWLRALYMSGHKWVAVLYPLLLIADLSGLIGLAFALHHAKNPDEADDDNMIMSVLQAKHALPTPLSWLREKIYVAKRPVAGYTDESKTINLRYITDMTGPQSAMAWKHRKATGAPPFYEWLYKEVLEKNGL